MQKVISDSTYQIRILSIIYLVLGFVLAFFNTDILTSGIQIAGVLLLIASLYLFYVWYSKQHGKNMKTLIMSIPLLLASLVMCFSPQSLLSILPILTALVIIANSIIQMMRAVELKRLGLSRWLSMLVLAVIMLVGGLVLLLRPIQTLEFIMRIAGVSLMLEGIMLLADTTLFAVQ